VRLIHGALLQAQKQGLRTEPVLPESESPPLRPLSSPFCTHTHTPSPSPSSNVWDQSLRIKWRPAAAAGPTAGGRRSCPPACSRSHRRLLTEMNR
jgi:hypothetical protein